MTYELAKKLKDAGFPFKNNWENDDFLECDLCGDGGPMVREGEEFPINLATLIEACGKYFGELNHYRNSGDWEAIAKDWKDAQGVGRFASGSTPEEAVAELWLSINKK